MKSIWMRKPPPKPCSLNGGYTNTFNISTATALVVAGGGLKVAKYGARADSTFCGSADVVAALGVNLNITLTEVERCIRQVGIGCLYAQLFPYAVAFGHPGPGRNRHQNHFQPHWSPVQSRGQPRPGSGRIPARTCGNHDPRAQGIGLPPGHGGLRTGYAGRIQHHRTFQGRLPQ